MWICEAPDAGEEIPKQQSHERTRSAEQGAAEPAEDVFQNHEATCRQAKRERQQDEIHRAGEKRAERLAIAPMLHEAMPRGDHQHQRKRQKQEKDRDELRRSPCWRNSGEARLKHGPKLKAEQNLDHQNEHPFFVQPDLDTSFKVGVRHDSGPVYWRRPSPYCACNRRLPPFVKEPRLKNRYPGIKRL